MPERCPYFSLCFWFLKDLATGFFPMPECLYCHFVLLLDLMKSHQTCPAVRAGRTCRCSWDNDRYKVLRGALDSSAILCELCVFDHWSTHMNFRVLRRVFLVVLDGRWIGATSVLAHTL